MSGTPDIFLPVGPGSGWGDNETRYLLRSLEKHGANYGRIFVVGRVPFWLKPSDRLVLIARPEAVGHKNARIAAKTQWVFEQTDISDDAVQLNDDYVFTAPIDLARLRPQHKGDLLPAAERHRSPGYRSELAATWRMLREAKAPTLHYDLHVPVIFNRSAFLALRGIWQRSAEDPHGYVVRSTYFNLTGAPDAVEGRDCKLGGAGGVPGMTAKISGRPFFSYADSAIAAGLARMLQEMFPTPSSHERRGIFTVKQHGQLTTVSV